MNHFMSKMYPSQQYQQQSAPAPIQVQVQPVQYQQAAAPIQYQQAAAPIQYQPAAAPIQYRQAVAPIQYRQVATPVQVQYQQAAPVQVAPVQFYYQSWPQVRQAPAEPTIIYIQRSEKQPESANAGNINVTTHSTSSSVANANNNNVVQTPPPPPPPAAQSAPVSLQSVVVVHNPAPVAPARESPMASTRGVDDAIVTSAETTTVPAPTTTEASTTLAQNAAAPSHDVVGVGALPVTLQSFVVLGGQQTPPTSVSAPSSVITIQDEPSTVGQFESTSGPIYSTQPVPVQGSTSPIQAGDTIFEHPC